MGNIMALNLAIGPVQYSKTGETIGFGGLLKPFSGPTKHTHTKKEEGKNK